MLRRPISALLILLLLTMQYAALAHSIEHLFEGEEHSDCPTCTLAQHFKHAPSANSWPIPEQGGIDIAAYISPTDAFPAAAAAFQSRAPPSLPF